MNCNIKIILFVVVSVIVGGFVGMWSSQQSSLPTPEQLMDLSNTSTRDMFCQSHGYTNSTIIDEYIGDPDWQSHYGGRPGRFTGKKLIRCNRIIEETKSYSYTDYKRWFIDTNGW